MFGFLFSMFIKAYCHSLGFMSKEKLSSCVKTCFSQYEKIWFNFLFLLNTASSFIDFSIVSNNVSILYILFIEYLLIGWLFSGFYVMSILVELVYADISLTIIVYNCIQHKNVTLRTFLTDKYFIISIKSIWLINITWTNFCSESE